MPGRDHQRFEWPDRPEWNDDGKVLIAAYQSCLQTGFKVEVLAKQAAAMACTILEQCSLFFRGDHREVFARPYLAMRMRAAGAHHRAAILKDLHMSDRVMAAEFLILRCQCIHDVSNVGE